jgi:hypothetical protein
VGVENGKEWVEERGRRTCWPFLPSPPPLDGCKGGPELGMQGCQPTRVAGRGGPPPFPARRGPIGPGLAEGVRGCHIGLALKGQPSSLVGPTPAMALAGLCQRHWWRSLSKSSSSIRFYFFQFCFLVVVENVEYLLSIIWILLSFFMNEKI